MAPDLTILVLTQDRLRRSGDTARLIRTDFCVRADHRQSLDPTAQTGPSSDIQDAAVQPAKPDIQHLLVLRSLCLAEGVLGYQ